MYGRVGNIRNRGDKISHLIAYNRKSMNVYVKDEQSGEDPVFLFYIVKMTKTEKPVFKPINLVRILRDLYDELPTVSAPRTPRRKVAQSINR